MATMSGQFDQVDTGAKMAVVKQAGGIEHCLAPTKTSNGEIRMAEILATRKPKKMQTLQYYVHYVECEEELHFVPATSFLRPHIARPPRRKGAGNVGTY